jgi:acetate---CoA ligase (ADP-forming)
VLAQEPEIGVIAVSQDSPAHFDVAVAEATAQAAAASEKCFVYFSNFSGPYRPEVQAILRQAGVPYLQGIRESLKAIKALMTYHAHPQPTPIATAPDHSRRDRVARLCAESGAIITEDVAKSLLAEYGFPVVRETLVASADEAVAAALAFGYPVVAKVVSADVTHKAVSGGVRLNLASPEDLMEAVRSMREDIGTACPDAVIKAFVVQPMVRPGIEVILGIKRDPQFGPTLVFGLGGIFVEAIRDVAIRLAPLSAAEAGSMVQEVPALQRMATKLSSPHDLPGVAASLLLKLSNFAADLPDEVEAVDINPVILDPASGTATVVDALIVKRQDQGR